jgi:hypothetical protein
MPNPTSLLPLKDIHLPNPLPWWPPAPIWFVVFALVLIGLALSAIALIKRYRQQRYCRLALLQLQQLRAQPNTAGTAANLAYLVKQIAVLYFPQADVAKTTGSQWLRFLDQTTSHNGFEQYGQALIDAAYRPAQDAIDSLCPLMDTIERWLHALKSQKPNDNRSAL